MINMFVVEGGVKVFVGLLVAIFFFFTNKKSYMNRPWKKREKVYIYIYIYEKRKKISRK